MTDSARADNSRLNYEEFLAGCLVLVSRPTMVFLELTQNCNLACTMCRHAGAYDESRNMELALANSVIRELAPLCEFLDLRGWGESTILPYFDTVLSLASYAGPRIRLVTNGLAIKDTQWRQILLSDGVVAVSIDAADALLFSRLGRGDLSKVLRNVQTGVRIQSEVGLGSIYFNVVVSAFNVSTIDRIVSLAASVGLKRIVLNPIQASEDSFAAPPVHLLRDAMCRSRVIADDFGVEVQIAASLHPNDVIGSALPTVCNSPWSHCQIAYNGDVIFCDHLLNKPSYSVGNLGGSSFASIWNGSPFQEVRRAHLTARVTRAVGPKWRKCDWCYSNRYADSERPALMSDDARYVSIRSVQLGTQHGNGQ